MLPPKLAPHCPSVETFPVDDGATEEEVVELAADVTISVVVDEARIEDEDIWLANEDSDEVTTLEVVVVEDDGTGAEEMDEVVMIIVEEDVAREVLKEVDVLTLVTVEDDVGRVGGLAGVQVPNPFWHPVPQCAAVEPQYPSLEQQCPNMECLQVRIFQVCRPQRAKLLIFKALTLRTKAVVASNREKRIMYQDRRKE